MKKWVGFSGLSLVLGLATFTVCLAQEIPKADAPRVLQADVGYRTVKNNALAQMSEATKAELAALEKAEAAANAAGNPAEGLKLVHHAATVASGIAYTPMHALQSALIARTDRAIVEPGQAVTVRLGQWYPLDEKPAGKLTVNILLTKPQPRGVPPATDGVSLTTMELGAGPGDWNTMPLGVSVTAPDVPDGGYALTVAVKSASEEFVALGSATVRVARGVPAKMTALRDRIAKMPNADPSAAYRVALYDLANAGEVSPSSIDFTAEIAEANAILDAQAKKTNPWAARHGDLRKAYKSAVDDSLQPYRVFVPSSYDGKKELPLVVALHGMGGDENSMFDGYGSVLPKLAEQYNYIVVAPKGRGPAAMYRGTAERDVLDVIAETRKAYRVDGERVYLTGHSMGGYGTWSLAQAYPEMFTALAPISGGGNAADMKKLSHVPQYVVHGDADPTVSVEQSRMMVTAGKAAGVPITYVEVKGGNHISVAAPAYPDIFAFFESHKRKAPMAAAAQ